VLGTDIIWTGLIVLLSIYVYYYVAAPELTLLHTSGLQELLLDWLFVTYKTTI
jgi:hypothetical protein